MEKSYVGMFQCYFCNESMGILLDRRLRNSFPMHVGVIDMEPCDKCKGHMEQGVILISIKDSTTEDEMKGRVPNPYRTGGWAVISEDATKRIFDGDFLEFALKNRFMFIADSAWEALGLPK